MLIAAALTLTFILLAFVCLIVAGILYLEDEAGPVPLVFVSALLLLAAAIAGINTVGNIQDYSCLAESILKE